MFSCFKICKTHTVTVISAQYLFGNKRSSREAANNKQQLQFRLLAMLVQFELNSISECLKVWNTQTDGKKEVKGCFFASALSEKTATTSCTDLVASGDSDVVVTPVFFQFYLSALCFGFLQLYCLIQQNSLNSFVLAANERFQQKRCSAGIQMCCVLQDKLKF